MEFAILFVMGAIALVIVTFIMMLVTRSELGQLRREVASLRARLREIGGAQAEPKPTTAAAAAAPPPPRPVPADRATPPPPTAPVDSTTRPRPRPPRSIDLEKIIGGQWLTWLGIIAIFLGTAFFLAIDLGDSPLAGLPQVLIASAVALIFLAIGRGIVHGVHRFLGLGLLGGGIALLYLVAYGLFGFHQLVGAEIVFPALLAVAVLGALVALAQNSLTIAGLTLIGALLTPLVLASDQGAAVALLPYLVGVNLGAVLVGRRRGWAGLALGSFLGTALLVASWWGPHFSPAARTLVLVSTTAIWVLYGIVPWLGQVRPGFWGLARTVLVAINATWYGAIVHQALGPDLTGARGPALFTIAVVYIVASVVGGRGRRKDPALVANFYTGAALAIIAVPVQFDGFSISLAWAMVGMLLLVMGWRLGDPHHRLAALTGLLFAAGRVVLTGLFDLGDAPAGFRPVLNLPFLADAAVVVALFGAAWIQRRTDQQAVGWEKTANRFIQPAAAFTAWWVVTFETAAWMDAYSGTGPPLVTLPLVWAVYAAAALGVGLWRGHLWLRRFALASLAVAALGAFMIQVTSAVTATSSFSPFLNAGFLAGISTVAVLVWVARVCCVAGPRVAPGEHRQGTPLLVATLGFGLVVATLEMLAWFHASHGGDIFSDGAALLTISIFWTLYGGVLIWSGFGLGVRSVRLAGMSLLGLVALKVFAVDMRALSAGYRIVSFVGVGALLLVISLLYQRERRTDGGAEPE